MYKIVQMLPALGWGGAQVFCIQLSNELAKNPDYDVTLVSLYDHTSNHMPVDRIDKKVKFITLGKKNGLDIDIYKKVYALLKKLQPDVVHTHLHAGYYVMWAYLRMKNNFAKVHTFHSLVTKDAPWHGRQMNKYFFRKAVMHPVSISDEVLKGAIKEYGKNTKTLIYNGSDTAKATNKLQEVTNAITALKKNANTKVLISVGRIYDVKNHRLIIEAMKVLAAEGANVIALIVGGHLPQDQALYDELIKDKPACVHFLGKANNVGDYLLNADAFLMPSLYEGLPISLLEAMSVGLVPICTPVGGLLDIIKPGTGYLSKDLSTESYVAAIKKFLNLEPTELQSLKQNIKTVFQNEYSMESCAKKYDALYHSL
ncbi:glycosyltransferase family 4 protein [Panacibacter ginsenosidivorans]|uniref:Glycosyltransferase family 4 protein n=1 Tax=Panacibacter ginsenosidivorans TaxID=1813871 RepID=A0A5B8V820_9BACT|nr:glycosyltransferase family 4 protein [Panacibacter ginsenosidivorans]QEC67379.1 glycosyltransferase family 4 protein [Panacibacter ginsenosidivorans]